MLLQKYSPEQKVWVRYQDASYYPARIVSCQAKIFCSVYFQDGGCFVDSIDPALISGVQVGDGGVVLPLAVGTQTVTLEGNHEVTVLGTHVSPVYTVCYAVDGTESSVSEKEIYETPSVTLSRVEACVNRALGNSSDGGNVNESFASVSNMSQVEKMNMNGPFNHMPPPFGLTGPPKFTPPLGQTQGFTPPFGQTGPQGFPREMNQVPPGGPMRLVNGAPYRPFKNRKHFNKGRRHNKGLNGKHNMRHAFHNSNMTTSYPPN